MHAACLLVIELPTSRVVVRSLVQGLERDTTGKLARLVDGIKEKLAGAGGGSKKQGGSKAVCYDKVDKTESMRVEIRSRRARQLIAKNLAVADDIAGGGSPRGGCVGGGGGKKTKKKRFLAF